MSLFLWFFPHAIKSLTFLNGNKNRDCWKAEFPARVTSSPLLDKTQLCADCWLGLEERPQLQGPGLQLDADPALQPGGAAWPAGCSHLYSFWVYLGFRDSYGQKSGILTRWETTSPEGDCWAVVLGSQTCFPCMCWMETRLEQVCVCVV